MEDKHLSSAGNYTDESIRTMEGMKHIRLRPGMYIGGLGNGTDPRHGIYTILKEVIDNSVDEFTMGFGKNIIVDVDEKTASVRDYGQGIPLGSVTKAVSILNTSGRFDDSVYQKTIGLNGVGIKATNALSLDFYVASYRNGESSWAKFSQGELVDSGREKTTEKNGTSSTGVIFSSGTMSQKFGTAISGSLVALLLGIAGFTSGTDPVTDQTIITITDPVAVNKMIWSLFSIFPAVIMLLMIGLLYLYPIRK